MKLKSKKDPIRILIIDDEAPFTRMIKLNMEATGKYAVRTVNESPLARQVAREFHPEVVLLDIVMPEADGGDVAAQLRADPQLQDIPIIFVSAMVSRKESSNGLYASGGEHYLAKPITVELLDNAITAVLPK
jgi:CheY-like chemotaxis protein